MYNRKYYQTLDIQDKDIIYYLNRGKEGAPRRDRPLNSEISRSLKRIKLKAKKLFQPKSMYKIFNTSSIPSRACFEESSKVALAIVTLGKPLPEKVNNMMNKGKYVDGIILDAIGSTAVEGLADLVNYEIQKEVKKMSLQFSKRYSPGYCDWDLSDQKMIFELLPAHMIDVQLTDGYLMIPIKSISFAINIAENIAQTRWENRCKYCEKIQCSYRMI